MKVLGFTPDINKAIRKKLLTFGITPGTNVEVIRVAPMGDPIEIKLRGYLLSLRKNEFDMIRFESISCKNCSNHCE